LEAKECLSFQELLMLLRNTSNPFMSPVSIGNIQNSRPQKAQMLSTAHQDH
jgi:hypothetical protein